MAVSRRARVRAAVAVAVGSALFLVQVAASAALPVTDQAAVTPTTSAPRVQSAAPAPTPVTSTPGASATRATSLPTSVAPQPATIGAQSVATARPTPSTPIAHRAVSLSTATPTTSPTTSASAPSATATTTPSPTTSPSTPGWRADWVEDFTVPIEQTRWGRYGWGYQVPGQGAMGRYLQSNTFTSNGIMTLRTQYANGEWSSAGVSSGDFYGAAGGKWEVRAKFPVSKGIGYAFLLYPSDGSWPPEIDLLEGRVNGPQIMGAYHFGTNNSQSLVFADNPDMSGWHTYGVVIGATTITYTIDGRAWGTVTNPSVSTKTFWIGFQCGAMDPNGSAKQYETVDGGVPGPLTPAISDIQIDWVAHYTQT